jgi:predicted negative regulator of RcsB-dependent stress response
MSEELENKSVENADAPSSELSKRVGELSFLEKAGNFFQGNAKYITIGIGVLVLGFLGWMGYKKFIVEPENVKTAESLYQEESHIVDTQNWKAAIEGDSLQTSPGLIAKANKFEGYAGGNIAVYDLGIAYLNNGQPEEALKTLQNVTFDDENLATLALGACGDACMELEKVTDAINYYEQAYKRRPKNEMTAPLYMMKLANANEMTQKYDVAAKLYTDLIENFPYSQLKSDAEKNLVLVQAGTSAYDLK